MAKWEPHPFTSEEREAVRLDGLRYLVISQRIEQVQRDISPRPLLAEVEAQLNFALQSYKLRYFRLFRINDLPTELITNILRFAIWDPTVAGDSSRRLNAVERRLVPRKLEERAWAWFERARQTPLDIRIDGDPKDDDSDSDDDPEESVVLDPSKPSESATSTREILLRLFTKLATIRMLILVVDDWKSALDVLELLATFAPSTGVPMFRRFELHRGGLKNERRDLISWPKNMVFRPFLGGAVASSLVYLSLNGVSIDWSTSILANLTTLDIRRLPRSDFLDASRFREVLMNCPRLHKLSLDGAGPKFEEQSSKPVKLPHLRVLVVADHSCQNAMFLFLQISAPDVNDLTLMNLCGEDYLPLFLQITPAFPKVRLLMTYSIQFDVSPVGLEAMRRWLDSIT
ncbi:hypothetical protein C8R45DRAFT_1150469 [Mycena sanguinolenta]|nr:hypothetical protein C8R45DRAFT_1150469 [Mycena sanguinolenta]